jgi:hypothetical protein
MICPKHFNIQYKEYQTIDKLNLDYVAMTRAKNLLCFVFKASYESKDNFQKNDTNKWGRLDFRKNISELKFPNKEDIFQNEYSSSPLKKTEEVIYEYYNSQSNEINIKSEQIKTNIEIDYYFYDYVKMIDRYEQKKFQKEIEISKEEIQILKNSLNTSLNKSTENYLSDNENKLYKYKYESKFKSFSATKLMSLADNRNKYEFKYLLGLNDEQSLEVENYQNYENDEFDLANISDKLKEDADNNKNLKQEAVLIFFIKVPLNSLYVL